MSGAKEVSVNLGGGTAFPLFCIFLTLKLAGVIDWSWWWVTCPLWLPLAVIFGFCGALLLGALVILGVGAIIAAFSK